MEYGRPKAPLKGNTMSQNCKVVKVISLVLMVLGIASTIMGVASFLGAPEVGAAGNTGIVSVQVASIVLAVAGIFEVITGFMGATGANHPSRLMPFIVFGTVILVVNVGEVALEVTGGTGPVWLNAPYAVMVLVAVLFAGRARREALR